MWVVIQRHYRTLNRYKHSAKCDCASSPFLNLHCIVRGWANTMQILHSKQGITGSDLTSDQA